MNAPGPQNWSTPAPRSPDASPTAAAAARSSAGQPTVRTRSRRHGAGHGHLHTVLDDHTRLAPTEDLPDETAATCAGFLTRATARSPHANHDRTGLTDNAWAYSEDTGRRARHDLATSPRWARHWRPRTKGKVGRFHRHPARRCPTPRRAPTIRRAARPPRRRSSRRRPGRRRSPSRRSASGRRSR
ncbi:transposase family protein [Streptomyces sp. SID8014]|nr:transposase family protein [Streptomyces sp. SID8014]